MNRTQTLAYLMLLLATLLLASCGHDRPMRIGVSQCSEDAWRRKMNDEIRREILFHDNLEVEIRSADDNSAKQIADLQYFVDNDFDIIICAPNEADSLTPKIAEIYASGLPVVLFDRTIHGETFTAYQGADNAEIGRQAALKAFELVGPQGKVLEITGLSGSTPAEERRSGFDTQAQTSGLDILAHVDGKWNYDLSARLMDSLLRVYPDVDLIYAHNDLMAIAAKEMARRHGRQGIKVIGIDAAPNIGVQAVVDSVLDLTFIYPTEGYQLVRTAAAILEGQPYERELYFSNPTMVDQKNAQLLLNLDKTLAQETEHIQVLSGQIDSYWKQHSLQTAALYGAIVILVLLGVVIFLLLRTYWSNNRHRREVESRNRELAKQKDEISELYQQLQDATQSKLTFFTNVSHDLRTSLTLIADPVDQLAQASNLTPGQHTLMQLANKNVKILMRLINQILDIRKFDNGQLKLKLADVNLGILLKEWASAFANAAIKNHINLNVDIDTSDDMTTAVDVDKMERVMFNLISNAFKFTPENGNIAIKASRQGDNIVIKVTDNGTGIAAEDINLIFDRFFKTDNINPQGSGIGLALTKVFVEMHSGTIAVESEKGAGTVFTVTLPVAHANSESSPVAITGDAGRDSAELIALEAPDEEVDSNAGVVLVIDDNPDICALIKSLLAGKYAVVRAFSGQEGIRKASKFIPDLIICDVMMPVMDGFETCRRLKNEVVTSHIPVLLLTACSQDSQRTEGYECGADGYMAKPFDSRMLLARCDALIANRRRIYDAGANIAPAPDKSAPKHDIDDEFYSRFVRVVEENISNPDLTVEDMAERLGLSRVQMYRKIKALTNYSPTEMLRILRLKRAATLLKTQQNTISQVCYAVGFSSPSYFTKCYKDYFGESPSDTQARTSASGK